MAKFYVDCKSAQDAVAKVIVDWSSFKDVYYYGDVDMAETRFQVAQENSAVKSGFISVDWKVKEGNEWV